jgi:hypothetical protein
VLALAQASLELVDKPDVNSGNLRTDWCCNMSDSSQIGHPDTPISASLRWTLAVLRDAPEVARTRDA